MKKALFWALCVCLFPGSCLHAQLNPQAATPPVAKRIPRSFTIHGDTRVDDYFWLREKSNPDVIAYLDAENAYTEAVMKPTVGFQEKLYKEILGRVKQTDLSVPYRKDGYWYYTRTETGKQYPIHCRKKGSLEGAEEVLLDLNELAKGHKFLGLGGFAVSDDANLLAYTTDVTGFREYTLYVKDLLTGKTLPDKIAKVQAISWAADNKTIFYVREDHAKRPHRLFRHVLGAMDDPLVYEEKDELYRLGLHRSLDKAYLLITSQSSTTSEARYLPSDQPSGSLQVILPREADHEYHVEHRQGLFYIRTNKGVKNFRLVTAPVKDPIPQNWKDLVPGRDKVFLQDVEVFKDHVALIERENGLQKLRILDLKQSQDHTVPMPEPVFSLMPAQNAEFETTEFRYRYNSLVTPDSVFAYDMNTRTKKLLKQTEVLGGYDPSQYQSERIFATATDGTKVPISMVYKKGIKRDGKSPLLLYGYGSYGFSLPITFTSSRLSLLDRGVIYAMAHIRGGKEMGQLWYEDGKMMHKRNTFTDFIACADYLAGQKYTSHDRLAIEGGSAGGLLIGAVLNLRPDVCKAAVMQVPFVDVINTMLDASLPLTVQEYLEWGNPNNKSEYEYMKMYCPYTNLSARSYPSILVRTSLNDSQVMYWEPAKYVAKLRSLKNDQNVLLFKINMAAGHGGASGRYDAFKEQALTYAFVLNQLGITQ